MKIELLFAAAALYAGSILGAPWVLDNDESRISFVSTKAGNVAEVHKFNELSGIVSPSGEVSIAIELASVDTLIPIRDERMREMLFDTDAFPMAKLKAKLDVADIEAMPVGSVSTVAAELTLNLHGKTLPLTVELLVARLSKDKLIATTRQPVIVNAAGVDLVQGIERLREIAGLPSISNAVPVAAVLTFNRVEDG